MIYNMKKNKHRLLFAPRIMPYKMQFYMPRYQWPAQIKNNRLKKISCILMVLIFVSVIFIFISLYPYDLKTEYATYLAIILLPLFILFGYNSDSQLTNE